MVSIARPLLTIFPGDGRTKRTQIKVPACSKFDGGLPRILHWKLELYIHWLDVREQVVLKLVVIMFGCVQYLSLEHCLSVSDVTSRHHHFLVVLRYTAVYRLSSLCLTDGPSLWLVRQSGTRCLTVLRNHDISRDNFKRLYFKTHLKHPAHQSLFYDDGLYYKSTFHTHYNTGLRLLQH